VAPTKQAKSQRQQWQGSKTPSGDRMEEKKKPWEKPYRINSKYISSFYFMI